MWYNPPPDDHAMLGIQEELEERGNAGWELCGQVTDVTNDTGYIFKRPLTNAALLANPDGAVAERDARVWAGWLAKY